VPKPFKVILGIDQTGATYPGRTQAKPLPLVVATRQDKKWKLQTQYKGSTLYLKKLDRLGIENILEQMGVVCPLPQVACIVDCVFGLPAQLLSSSQRGSDYLWEAFFRAADFSLKEKEFGREVAQKFFSHWWSGPETIRPRRFCEEIAQSNSVFQLRPYQKNIQTGTFRIWKDMGSAKKPWASIWPFDERRDQGKEGGPWFFEGYPSLVWRKMLGASRRDSSQLRMLTQKTGLSVQVDSWKNIESCPNRADSFVLALGAIILDSVSKLWEPSPFFLKELKVPKEGWLLGLEHPRDI